MVAAYEGFEQLASIAKRLHVSVGSIHEYRKRGGVSRRGRSHLRGENSPTWKGGRTVGSDGYVKIRQPDGSKRREHHLVMERFLGRRLLPAETVHHKDGNRQNNKLSNLQLRKGRHGNGQVMCCRECGSENIVYKEV